MKRIILIIILLSSFLFIISCSDSRIYGSWKTEHVEFDIKGADEILIKRGLTVAYATTYQFNDDNSFIMTINENEVDGDIQRRYTGRIKLENGSLELITDSLYARKTGFDWKEYAYNQTYEYSIKKLTKNQLVFTEKVDNNGSLHYTLERNK